MKFSDALMIMCFRLALSDYLYVNCAMVDGNQTRVTEECLANMKTHLNHYCTYPGKNTPCFKSSIEYNGHIYNSLNVDGLAMHCCANLETCTRAEIQKNYCCFHEPCIDNCYKLVRRRKFMRRRPQFGHFNKQF